MKNKVFALLLTLALALGLCAPAMAAGPFTDVPQDAYFRGAVLWAVENGVTTGTSPTAFSPHLNCTRAEIITFIYRAMELL